MITKETVQHIAGLAKLDLSTDEIDVFAAQMASVVEYFDALKKVDVKNVKPLVTPTQIAQHLREDKMLHGMSAEELMANAPETSGHLFKVPPVV